MPAVVKATATKELTGAAANMNFRGAGPHRFRAQVHQDQTRLCAVWHGSRYELPTPEKLSGGDLDSGGSAATLKTPGIGLRTGKPNLTQHRMQILRAIGLLLDDIRRRVDQAALQERQLVVGCVLGHIWSLP
jgi:hypothetical protein